jgi:murein DD-endopeptidase MepM/ murein hydrolase activator NlpD
LEKTEVVMKKLVNGIMKSKFIRPLGLLFFGCMLVFVSCQTSEEVPEEYFPNESHAQYIESLVGQNLHETLMGQEWIAAGDPTLNPAFLSMIPFQEDRYFDRTVPDAAYYLFEALIGQEVRIAIRTESEIGYFADLFALDNEFYPEEGYMEDWESNSFQPIATARSSAQINTDGDFSLDSLVIQGPSDLSFVPRNKRFYLLRVQPQLLEESSFNITINSDPLLSWPVEGSGFSDVISHFGAPRDGGSRVHHGIDIIAPRGRNLVASDDLYISRIQTRERGGKTVFLEDRDLGFVYYYAHLDEWDENIQQGQFLREGTRLGTVGNTGNAFGGPFHLHFGVYQRSWRGAVDPWYFFVDTEDLEPQMPELYDSQAFINEYSQELESSDPEALYYPQFAARAGFNLSSARLDKDGIALEEKDRPINTLSWGEAENLSSEHLRLVAKRDQALGFIDPGRRIWWYLPN